MKKFDQWIHKELQKQAPEMSSEIEQHFENTLAEIRQKHSNNRFGLYMNKAAKIFAVSFVIMILILPNLHPSISYAMQEIPMLKDIVRVFTIYKKDVDDTYHPQHINIPKIEADTKDSENAVKYINDSIEDLTQKVIRQYEEDIKELPDGYMGLEIDYEIITNTESWFTLRLMIYQDAGSGNAFYHYYHIDKRTGNIVRLSDLFIENFDYVNIFTNEIKKQMQTQMSEDPNVVYWAYSDNNMLSGFFEIKKDQNFYFNDSGDLVIVFDKYEVGPGSMGHPEFVISKDVFETSLK